jgi:hypothetical protein
MDRKAAIRQYRESRRPMGVYRVRSTATGRFVVGASPDLPAALNRQRAQLRLGGHPDRALQQEWNERGPDAFEFEVLDTLEPPAEGPYDPSDDLRAMREMWMERLGGASADG